MNTDILSYVNNHGTNCRWIIKLKDDFTKEREKFSLETFPRSTMPI